MNAGFEAFSTACRARCETALRRLLTADDAALSAVRDPLQHLDEACAYSLLDGGKRVRPVLVYAAAEAVGGDADGEALDHAASAIEMVHVYSLVHDDLPAMDDDDLRRGRPSCHRAFDEATAILVGDALQARAFELLASIPGTDGASRAAMVRTLAAAAGARGMVGGQAVDIAAVDTSPDLAQMRAMHELKTGALIRAALALGGIAAGANGGQLGALEAYGSHIGLAFQVVDDILDVEGDPATLGKTGGKDRDANKPTYVDLMGADRARREAHRLLQSALDALRPFGAEADHLRDMAHFIVGRSH